MSEEVMSREMALRIGLAAREVPELEVYQLIALLNRLYGVSLSAARLSSIGVDDLRRGARVLHYDAVYDAAQETLQRACACLRGESEGIYAPAEGLPEPVAEQQASASIRVACASNSAEQLDGHFGSCARFLVYQVTPGEARLIDVRSCANVAHGVARTDKSAARAGLIEDCHILYCCSIGPPAAAKVVRVGLMPLKQPRGGSASGYMADLAALLEVSPPPWLGKLLGKSAQSRSRYAGTVTD